MRRDASRIVRPCRVRVNSVVADTCCVCVERVKESVVHSVLKWCGFVSILLGRRDRICLIDGRAYVASCIGDVRDVSVVVSCRKIDGLRQNQNWSCACDPVVVSVSAHENENRSVAVEQRSGSSNLDL